MRPYGEVALALAIVTLVMLSTIFWVPPHSTSISVKASVTRYTGHPRVGHASIPLKNIEVTSAATVPLSPAQQPRSKETPSKHVAGYPWVLTAIANFFRWLWSVLLKALNALYRGLSLNTGSRLNSSGAAGSAGQSLSYYALAVIALFAAVAAYIARRRVREEGATGALGIKPKVNEAVTHAGNLTINDDPVIRAIKVLTTRASKELGRRPEALTHRDVLKVCNIIPHSRAVKDFIRLYERWRFAGEGVRSKCVRLAENILKGLGVEG